MMSGGAVSWKSRQDKIVSRFLPLKLSMSLPANAGRKSFTFEKSSVILVFPLPTLPVFMRTILLVWPCQKTLSAASLVLAPY